MPPSVAWMRCCGTGDDDGEAVENGVGNALYAFGEAVEKPWRSNGEAMEKR